MLSSPVAPIEVVGLASDSLDMEPVCVFGVGIPPISLRRLLGFIEDTAHHQPPAVVTNININAMTLHYEQPWPRVSQNPSSVVFCDGHGPNWAASLGAPAELLAQIERASGRKMGVASGSVFAGECELLPCYCQVVGQPPPRIQQGQVVASGRRQTHREMHPWSR